MRVKAYLPWKPYKPLIFLALDQPYLQPYFQPYLQAPRCRPFIYHLLSYPTVAISSSQSSDSSILSDIPSESSSEFVPDAELKWEEPIPEIEEMLKQVVDLTENDEGQYTPGAQFSQQIKQQSPDASQPKDSFSQDPIGAVLNSESNARQDALSADQALLRHRTSFVWNHMPNADPQHIY